MSQQPVRFAIMGRSFAPPITPQKLAEYRALGESLPTGQVREVILLLCQMVEVFQQTPMSKEPPVLAPGCPMRVVIGENQKGQLVNVYDIPLEQKEVERIWDYVPWPSEIAMYRDLLKTVPPGPVYEALGYLIWYATELAKDREPMTQDRLVPA